MNPEQNPSKDDEGDIFADPLLRDEDTLRVARFFLARPAGDFTKAELAKATTVSRGKVDAAIRFLLEFTAIRETRQIGPARLYQLDAESSGAEALAILCYALDITCPPEAESAFDVQGSETEAAVREGARRGDLRRGLKPPRRPLGLPLNAAEYAYLARTAGNLGRCDLAVRAMRHAIALDPYETWNYHDLAHYYDNLGDQRMGLKVLREGLPYSVDGRVELTLAVWLTDLSAGRWEEVARLVEKALDADPSLLLDMGFIPQDLLTKPELRDALARAKARLDQEKGAAAAT